MAEAPGIVASCKLGGEELISIHIEAQGPVSVQVEELKRRSMAFCNRYLDTHGLSTEEVDLVEETAEDVEGEAKRGKKRKDRKQA